MEADVSSPLTASSTEVQEIVEQLASVQSRAKQDMEVAFGNQDVDALHLAYDILIAAETLAAELVESSERVNS